MRTLAVVLALLALGGCTGGWTKCEDGIYVNGYGQVWGFKSAAGDDEKVVEYRSGDHGQIEWRLTVYSNGKKAGGKEGVIALKAGDTFTCK
jgi:hypothetical protein